MAARLPRGDRRPAWSSRNPPATRSDYRRALAVARRAANELAHGGARAVVLTGSWARGDARRESDIDLWAIGRRRGNRILARDGFLVTVALTTPTAERRKLRDPQRVGGCVPGWRIARPLYDPSGIAAGLRSEARRFRWTSLGASADRWVADQTVAWAEEAIKLVRALAVGSRETAAVQRNLLVDALGFVVAVRLRQFWDSENEFWERIGRRAGGRWARAQRAALGLSGVGFEESCRAALELYARTARTVLPCLSREQRTIVEQTLRVIA